MATEVNVPTLGESITEATLGEWLKQPGDPVAVDEPIASLETDKVSVEVPSPVAGVMGQQAVKVGDTVQVGAMIATIEAGSGASAATAQPAAAAPAPAAAAAPAPAGDGPAALSPSVRRAVLEHGVDPATVVGTGKDGRITKDDVIAAAATPAPAAAPSPEPQVAPSVAASTGRKEERVRMTRLRQTIAKRLKERRTPRRCLPPSTTST